MDAEIKAIEEAFGITLTHVPDSRSTYSYNKHLTLADIASVLKEQPDRFQWQDFTDPSCGNNNGVWYLVLILPVPSEYWQEGDDNLYATCFAFTPYEKLCDIM